MKNSINLPSGKHPSPWNVHFSTIYKWINVSHYQRVAITCYNYNVMISNDWDMREMFEQITMFWGSSWNLNVPPVQVANLSRVSADSAHFRETSTVCSTLVLLGQLRVDQVDAQSMEISVKLWQLWSWLKLGATESECICFAYGLDDLTWPSCPFST